MDDRGVKDRRIPSTPGALHDHCRTYQQHTQFSEVSGGAESRAARGIFARHPLPEDAMGDGIYW
jgi:Zn-dependent membrane protease YugP